MGRKLVIVESPAKAKTIGRYLGKDYRISASVGHIRDLPEEKLGVDVKKDFAPKYVNKKGKEKVITELRDEAKNADLVLLATDPDREGEAIAWHIAKVLDIREDATCRITFNEITENAVRKAVSEPRAINMDLVNSQQARRILDRLVGYELSPLLWKKVKKGLSAGRVQSVATRMIVDREEEIDRFKPEEYWVLTALLAKHSQKKTFRARYHGHVADSGGLAPTADSRLQKIRVEDKDTADRILEEIKDRPFSVLKVKKGAKKRSPFPPFTTSTLQQEAARRLGFTSKKTMSIAQQLYEGVDIQGHGTIALVTYIRTDSVRISDEAMSEARHLIAATYGAKYVPSTPRRYSNRNTSQDAHEAVRPAHFDLAPDQVKESITYDQHRLYRLIWERFLASQMPPAEIDTVTVDTIASTQVFRAVGETLRFDGFLAAYADLSADREEGDPTDEDDTKERIPELAEGEPLDLSGVQPEQKFTLPPPRYTEATLIKALEEQGIGRPSTYAPTISTILDRKYVDKEKKTLFPTELGKVVTELLKGSFSEIVDLGFTADMEGRLDKVEQGERNWIEVLKDFYPHFHEQIVAAGALDRVKVADVPTGEKCPTCSEGDLVIKEGRFGKFIACSRYPECKFTRNIEQTVKGICPKCGSGLAVRVSKKFKGKRFYTCDRKGPNAECDFISWDLPLEGKSCETCGGYMVWKSFKGRGFPKCGNRDCPTNVNRKRKDGSEEAGTTTEPVKIDTDV